MTRKLVRFDEDRWIRLDLDTRCIEETGKRLKYVCLQHLENDPNLAPKLKPLLDYAELGIQGLITAPRSWSVDPLRYEFREDQLPEPILEAYAQFIFCTHGLTQGDETVVKNGNQSFIEVDE